MFMGVSFANPDRYRSGFGLGAGDCESRPGCVILGIEQACETICATREFWQIRRQNEFVFNCQARPSLDIFPISQGLHMSQTALCNPRIHSGKCQSSPKQERSVLAGTESHSCRDVLTAVGR